MDETIKWHLCILCQKQTDEELVCPLANPVASRREGAYEEITNLVSKFREFGSAPHPDVELANVESMQKNHASWHKSCRHMYKPTALARAERSHSQELLPVQKKLKRTGEPVNRNLCLFCGQKTNVADHSFQKLELTKQIHDKAVALEDDRIVAILAEGDLVAIEGRYHRNCYTGFNRRYDAICKQDTPVENLETTLENELLQFIHEEIAGGRTVFALQDLTEMMTDKLEQHGIHKTVNRTRLKETILEYFPNLTEEKGIRDRVFIVCSKMARKIISDATQTPDEEARILLMAASILRKAVLNHNTAFMFDGSFPDGCEEAAVPERVKYFFRQLLAGPNSSPELTNSRKILSVSQIAMFNMTSLSANLNCEPPLAVFLALNLHSQTRSKKLVELLHTYAVSLSYKKILNIEMNFAKAIAAQTNNNNGVVCPTNLRQFIFTVAALDNLDHNPTSRTATSSFHGTGISIFQFPTAPKPGLDQECLHINLQKTVDTRGPMLPRSYTFVPPVGRNLVTKPPVKVVQPEAMSSFAEEKKHEQAWMNAVHETISVDCDTDRDTPTMWSSFHAARSDVVGQPQKCIEALLPLFHDKAATPEMIRHGMDLVKNTIEYLNPNQVPVLVVDQPLFDLAKKIQWTFPEIFGEDKFVVLLGGLHIEMALWSTMGDVLRGSGWPEALKEAGLVKTEAAATAFLKASNVMRTRYAHQVTVVVLDSLLNRAYEDTGEKNMAFDDWVKEASQSSPTFKFWLLIYKYEQIIFMFIRAHRERKFELMVTTLRMLVPLFFALDHQNYARWVPIFIRDLERLPDSIHEEFQNGNWAINRSSRRFSALPIDQAHEQANKRVKGVGGIIGLTENPAMLERWIVTGPEISRIVEEFTCEDDTDDGEELPHHEEGYAPQQRFQRHVTDLTELFMCKTNPFEEDSEDLVTLNNEVCESAAAAISVQNIESIGQEQYKSFRENVLESNAILLTAPIKRNNLLLFHEKKTQRKTALKLKLQHFKDHAELYGQAFIALDSRGGNMEEFFRHESSPYPPALSNAGSLNSCTKSDLLVCIMEASTSNSISVDEEIVAPDAYDFIVIDGGALIHSLPGTSVQCKTFDSYYDKVFCPRVRHDLKRSPRVDIVWDQYRALTIKGGTREKRGTGTRQRVTAAAKFPGNWQKFLADADNKKELFLFLSKKIAEEQFQDDNDVYITADDQVHHAGIGPPMEQCNHEEADTRVLVHLLHALQTSSLGMVYTGDTDVVVILLSNFHQIKAVNPAAEIWISFKAGKTTRMICLNSLALNLGATKCKGMALFHAFTGSDSTSSFKFKGKRYCCKVMDTIPSLMDEFATIADTPFQTSPRIMDAALDFVCKLYCNEQTNDVDLVRMTLFSQKTRDVERIPPTRDALNQHLKRSVFQASIWTTAHRAMMPVNNPTDHGWKEENGKLLPVWTSLPLARDVFHLDVKCTCKATCSICKCAKEKLRCTRLCTCTCEK